MAEEEKKSGCGCGTIIALALFVAAFVGVKSCFRSCTDSDNEDKTEYVNSTVVQDDESIPSWVTGNWYGIAATGHTIQLEIRGDSYTMIFASDVYHGKLKYYEREQHAIFAEDNFGGTVFKVDESRHLISADGGDTWMGQR